MGHHLAEPGATHAIFEEKTRQLFAIERSSAVFTIWRQPGDEHLSGHDCALPEGATQFDW